MRRPKTTWTKERIQSLISQNALALERGLLVVYANQTADEKASGDTHHDNGMGFTGADAKFLSSVAEWVKNSRYREGFRLTPSQRASVLPLMLKYWRQIQNEIILKEKQRESFSRQPAV